MCGTIGSWGQLGLWGLMIGQQVLTLSPTWAGTLPLASFHFLTCKMGGMITDNLYSY